MKEPILTNRRTVLIAGAAVIAAIPAGCSDDAATGAEATGGSTGSGADDLSDVIFEGGATDEALIALLSHAPLADATQGTRFLAPQAGQSLDPAMIATFSWAVGPGASRKPGVLERALGLVLGVREAHAHGTPISGRGYFLVFSTPSNPKLLRVFTTLLTYTPQTEAWARLTAAAEPITASVVNAIFETNRVAQGGGPFQGSPLTFSIG